MKRVLITGIGPQHAYVANKLAGEAGLDAIIVDTGKPQSPAQRLRILVQRYSLRQLADRVLRRLAYAVWRDGSLRARQLLQVFGSDDLQIRAPVPVHRIGGINTDAGEELVRRLDADQILIFGTTLVSSRILKLSRQPALNMHTGLSPHYRGSACAFWPVHDGRFDMLGATVHECVPQVDGGAVYAVGRARLHSGDGLHAIFARCVQVGAELYVEVLKRFDTHSASGQEQDLSLGREFRAADRTFKAELRARRRLARGELENYLEAARTQEEGSSGVEAL